MIRGCIWLMPDDHGLDAGKDPSLFVDPIPAISAPSSYPLSTPPPSPQCAAEPRWLPSNSICGQRRGYLHEHVSHRLADIPPWQSHREEWNHAYIKVLFPFWSNSSFPNWCFAIFSHHQCGTQGLSETLRPLLTQRDKREGSNRS